MADAACDVTSSHWWAEQRGVATRQSYFEVATGVPVAIVTPAVKRHEHLRLYSHSSSDDQRPKDSKLATINHRRIEIKD